MELGSKSDQISIGLVLIRIKRSDLVAEEFDQTELERELMFVQILAG